MITKTIILKIGGSVVTYKNRTGLFIRHKNINRVAHELRKAIDSDKNLRLILVHGAGTAGHQIAKKHDLKSGTGKISQKIHAALDIHRAIQKLNSAIVIALSQQGLKIATVHSASTITQLDGRIDQFDFNVVDQALELGCIPIMYGEMVFDKTLGMSVCSGDAIVMWLATRYNAEKIIFTSDIDGIYDKDPHSSSDAKIIKTTSLESLTSNTGIRITGSHNVDVTGGLGNKIVELTSYGLPKSLRKVVICNGLKPDVLFNSFANIEQGTVISINE